MTGNRRFFTGMGLGVLVALWASAPGLAADHPAHLFRPSHSRMVCVVGSEVHPETGERRPVTTCLHTEERGPDFTDTPTVLHVQISSTRCFYLGSRPTGWVHLGYDQNGNLDYGWSPDGSPGGHTVIGTAPPCSWPGVEREEIEGYVWSRIGTYAHQVPRVAFDPPVPRGMAGIETFGVLAVPGPWMFSSTSPYTGRSLRAGVEVERVGFDWDDGPAQMFGPSDFPGFTGYPHGTARHTYQTKTCESPGPRCREKTGPYRIRTSFRWSGWYELADVEKSLRIPDTFADTAYPVREIVSLIVG